MLQVQKPEWEGVVRYNPLLIRQGVVPYNPLIMTAEVVMAWHAARKSSAALQRPFTAARARSALLIRTN